ncbi:MAG: beta-ketoacyl-[acyl-carrier-protein] synthase family protein [Trichlorobacter sp.]|uniref:beta-ketoacyl-[acyl-carrier-protein] synthase family protein n=1 Tax=Trichlorobacter sp. TaxID=2911007 RepID=UPI00256293F3|nr:beta-ketoacyl-[acyl-carrier-protein] synthase family protein [Trichlorobacter sp.]
MSLQRIAITGLGTINGAAKTLPAFQEAILQGTSGIAPLDLFDVSQFSTQIGCQVKEYNSADYFTRRQATHLSRTDQLALIAAREAVAMSGLTGVCDPYQVGVCIGGGVGGMLNAEEWLQGELSGKPARPGLLRTLLPDCSSTALAKELGFAGYQGSITTACSSSGTAIGWAADLIRTGRQQAMLCGGADALTMLTFAGFNALKVVDPNPCAPFSAGRQGLTLGEGAAFMVLEDEQAALQRGAQIYGYLLGYALLGEAHHMTAPEPSGESAARVMHAALDAAAVEKEQIGWINAHGTGTPLNDVGESNAVKLLFGERASQVPLISTKAITGHCLGAAGAIEAVATVLALNAGIIPQTLHFRGVDPACDLDYGHAGSRATDTRMALSNSFAFGGNVTSVVLGSAALQQEVC